MNLQRETRKARAPSRTRVSGQERMRQWRVEAAERQAQVRSAAPPGSLVARIRAQRAKEQFDQQEASEHREHAAEEVAVCCG